MAEQLFNDHGIQAVGIDAIRTQAGISLKRLYQLYPSKDSLVHAVLTRRDRNVLADVRRHVEARTDPRRRVLAVFDYLEVWFGDSSFRGCTFINTFGELGGESEAVAEIARHHKRAFRDYLRELAQAAGAPAELGDQLAILANGAMASAPICGGDVAQQARRVAEILLDAATAPGN
ncbi:TetR/AcrR family transcriptional regulator [Rhodococcus zopfii]|uniref:TetR/AcrR family transcriptional regulator n=1 Tax=Rhodococcus zopfii TaxID=43772 RepID=UPI001F1011CD|nr:TetR/AcrR family transcriptional regulator [Rhodococcus zopfii]